MQPEPGTWVLVVPPGRYDEALAPLIAAHERTRAVRIVTLPDHRPPTGESWRRWLEGSAGALLVGDRRYAPRSALPGPFIPDRVGRLVPVGWLPDVGQSRLVAFASSAARVVGRRGPVGPVVVMGQWEPRYLALATRLVRNLDQLAAPPSVFHWTADRITRDDLARALGAGPGMGVYFGHGRPRGWAGYHGLRAHHLLETPGEPLGALLSMTCRTASRWNTGLSFSESVVLGGAAAAAVGAVAPVRHLLNMRWMLGLVAALEAGEAEVGPALLRAAPPSDLHGSGYRIIGDPLAPLIGDPMAERRARAVWAPAPDSIASWHEGEAAG